MSSVYYRHGLLWFVLALTSVLSGDLYLIMFWGCFTEIVKVERTSTWPQQNETKKTQCESRALFVGCNVWGNKCYLLINLKRFAREDLMLWECFQYYWPFVWWIHVSLIQSSCVLFVVSRNKTLKTEYHQVAGNTRRLHYHETSLWWPRLFYCPIFHSLPFYGYSYKTMCHEVYMQAGDINYI